MATNTKATKATKYSVKALPVNSVQYRQASGGTGTPQATAYQQACTALAGWAKGTPNAAAVHALVHLGWCTGTGARSTNRASSSSACKAATAANLPAAQWAIGGPAAPQVVANLTALAAAGAPAAALATVWATFTGAVA